MRRFGWSGAKLPVSGATAVAGGFSSFGALRVAPLSTARADRSPGGPLPPPPAAGGARAAGAPPPPPPGGGGLRAPPPPPPPAGAGARPAVVVAARAAAGDQHHAHDQQDRGREPRHRGEVVEQNGERPAPPL